MVIKPKEGLSSSAIFIQIKGI